MIPGSGDLAPRRRPRRLGPAAAAVVVLVVLAAAGYVGYRHLDSSSSTPRATTAPRRSCAVRASTGFAPPSKVHVSIRNTTLRAGLAAQVGRALRHRGFHVSSVGNSATKAKTPVLVRYSADQARTLPTVREQFESTHAVVAPGRGTLEVYLGPHFTGVVTTAAARTARQRDVAADAARSSSSCAPSS